MNNSWSIIILAAGKGTRLQSSLPKPLVPINGTPLLQPIIELSLSNQFLERVVVISEFTQAIQDYFPQNTLTYVTTTPQGTADAVTQALSRITSDNILIAQSDDSFLYTQETLERIMAQHCARQADFTVGLADIEEPLSYRAGIWDPQTDRLLGIQNTPVSKPGDRVVCGLYAGTTQWITTHFPNIPAHPISGEIGIPTGFLHGIKRRDNIYMCPITSQEWMGINTPEELEKAISKIDKMA